MATLDGGIGTKVALARKSGFRDSRTRKGTLEDAIEGIDAGAVRIIKKPDPSESELQANPLSAAYDLAIETNRQHVIRDVEDAVRLSTWWWKHKEAVFAYFVGFLSSLGAGYLLHLLLKC